MTRDDSASHQSATAGAVMTHRQILLVIFGLMAGMFLSALDQTVVGTAIRTIGDDLHGLELQAWVTTAYLIVSTIATPIYGKLSDIFGRRPLFMFSIAVFIVGSLLSSFSTSMYELAVFRAIQGLGAGGLMSMPLAIMGDILAPRERAKYQGYFLAVFGISSVVGPLVGGLFAGADQILFISGWRWVFLINVPIGLLALGMVLRFLHLPKTSRHSVRIDWWGAATVIVALVPLLIVAEQGRDWGWASAGSITCYIVGGASAIAFVFVEWAMKDDALIPLKLFSSATFSMATVLGVLVGFGMFGAMLTVPLYLQLVLGSTPTESGYQMLPMILGLMIASITSGQIIGHTGRYRMFPILGTGLMAAGFFYFTFLTADKSIWFMMGGMLLIGLGLGQLMQTLTIASQNSVRLRDMGVATSASTFFRQIGGTLGTAVLFSVLFARIPETIKDAFSDQSIASSAFKAAANPAIAGAPENKGIMSFYKPILEALAGGKKPSVSGGGNLANSLNGDTSFLNGADHRLSEPFLVGFSNAAVTVFWVAFIVVAIAFVLSWFFKTPPLRMKSALQEAADEAHAADQAHAANEADTADEETRAALRLQGAADQMGALVEPGTRTSDVPIQRQPPK
ncbi:MDR family MFS transporter [Microbacterium sp. STN6]|uniref:MDR family MFS transporter n=1 Tax=Microbacterium sp. STN6 TaxID=2995588 RepID=UPI002260DC26|nr:MDR family MFS transporter [Microbacterium sp. STN6]MCX7522492.1 MDR family MFS transporter [Microbacterium sp. STN6]